MSRPNWRYSASVLHIACGVVTESKPASAQKSSVFARPSPFRSTNPFTCVPMPSIPESARYFLISFAECPP